MTGTMRLTMAVAGLVLTLAGCSGEDTSAEESTATAGEDGSAPTSTSTTTEPTTTKPTTTEPPPEPDPNATYSHSCDYVLGDFSETASGFRFLADANLRNSGNVGVNVKVTATWFLAGGDQVTDQRTIKLAVDDRERVGFSVIATQDQIDLHQALDAGKTCNVKAALIDTFGPVEG